jgi:hypothetical protein
MDAVALGWIVMEPHGDLPLILQKAGGLQGIFCYTAFAPTRGIGAFVAINKFDFAAAMAMAATAALVFFLFDLLCLDGEDWTPRPLIDSKTNLAALPSPVRDAIHPRIPRHRFWAARFLAKANQGPS